MFSHINKCVRCVNGKKNIKKIMRVKKWESLKFNTITSLLIYFDCVGYCSSNNLGIW